MTKVYKKSINTKKTQWNTSNTNTNMNTCIHICIRHTLMHLEFFPPNVLWKVVPKNLFNSFFIAVLQSIIRSHCNLFDYTSCYEYMSEFAPALIPVCRLFIK